MEDFDPYEFLGIDKDADVEDIMEAVRESIGLRRARIKATFGKAGIDRAYERKVVQAVNMILGGPKAAPSPTRPTVKAAPAPHWSAMSIAQTKAPPPPTSAVAPTIVPSLPVTSPSQVTQAQAWPSNLAPTVVPSYPVSSATGVKPIPVDTEPLRISPKARPKIRSHRPSMAWRRLAYETLTRGPKAAIMGSYQRGLAKALGVPMRESYHSSRGSDLKSMTDALKDVVDKLNELIETMKDKDKTGDETESADNRRPFIKEIVSQSVKQTPQPHTGAPPAKPASTFFGQSWEEVMAIVGRFI